MQTLDFKDRHTRKHYKTPLVQYEEVNQLDYLLNENKFLKPQVMKRLFLHIKNFEDDAKFFGFSEQTA